MDADYSGELYMFDEYFDFLDKRSELMKNAIIKVLPETYAEIAEKYGF